jgi:hypothetical protein
MRVLEAAGNTTHPMEIKQWNIENKEINVINKNGKVYFTLRQNGADTAIPASAVIGIPKNINLSMLKAFLDDTWVRVAQLGEHDYKLYIQPRLHGGGNIIADSSKLWPGGVVPFEIVEDIYPINSPERQTILDAIEAWNHARTGFKFVPVENTLERNILVFGEKNPEGLSTTIGYQGGRQYIWGHLHNGPLKKNMIMREIGHAVGFYDEQQRYDRDNYVQIATNGNFASHTKLFQENMFGKYDFGSIMHSPINKPLSNGQQINVSFAFPDDAEQRVGIAEKLSPGDIAAARYLHFVLRLSGQMLSVNGEAATGYKSSLALSGESATNREQKVIQILQQGNLYFEKEQYSEALEEYQLLVKNYDDQSMLHLDLAELNNLSAICCYYLGIYEEAKMYFQAALKIDSGNRYIQDNYLRVLI